MKANRVKLKSYKDHTIFFSPDQRNFIAVDPKGKEVQAASFPSLCSKISRGDKSIKHDEFLDGKVVSIRIYNPDVKGERYFYLTGVLTGNWSRKKKEYRPTVEVVVGEEDIRWVIADEQHIKVGDVVDEWLKVEKAVEDARTALNKFTKSQDRIHQIWPGDKWAIRKGVS